MCAIHASLPFSSACCRCCCPAPEPRLNHPVQHLHQHLLQLWHQTGQAAVGQRHPPAPPHTQLTLGPLPLPPPTLPLTAQPCRPLAPAGGKGGGGVRQGWHSSQVGQPADQLHHLVRQQLRQHWGQRLSHSRLDYTAQGRSSGTPGSHQGAQQGGAARQLPASFRAQARVVAGSAPGRAGRVPGREVAAQLLVKGGEEGERGLAGGAKGGSEQHDIRHWAGAPAAHRQPPAQPAGGHCCWAASCHLP
ncbi:hypothetical protein V8C86DRAFT_2956583 [Haematococcus lacustris]